MIIALTLLVFAGQVSAQSVSLTHILDEGRTQGIVFGQGTDIVVDVSATGFTQSVNAVTFAFDFDASLLTLNAPAGALKTADNKVIQLSITAIPVPATTRFTFTTKVNVTGQEFSIGLTEVTLDTTPFSVSEMIAFNSVLPPLYLDTQIESPAQNNNVLELMGKSPGDMIQFQVFVPDAAGHQFNAFQLELSLSGKTVSDYLSVLSQQGMAIQVTGNNLSLSLLSISAVTVPSNGYLDQVELSVTRALGSSDTLIVQQASLDGQQQLNVSSAALTFRTVCPGDFDDNGMINVADFLLFVAVFGTSSGDATYNAVMDIDGSGAVNVADFLLFVDVFGTTCETTSLPPPPPPSNPDRDALVALYNATDGPNWSSSMNWLSDKPIGEWYGVTTNANGLQRLDLGGNQLTGEIPGELGNLSNLQVLWLAGNQLTGEIPGGELGNLSNLQVLSLSNNQLTGEIPGELDNLSNLQQLSLGGNQLTGEIPGELDNLSNLQQLSLGGNQLTGEIPGELGNLSNLERLWLFDNQLTGEIPGELGNLSNLKELSLSNNQLTGEIPGELDNLSNLQQLSLDGNQLTGEIPGELGNLSNLQQLILSNNQLTGEIPEELGNLSNLNTLWLHNNQLTGEIPGELDNLSNLQQLSLDGNQLTGEIPEELGNLSNLNTLWLHNNQLTGEIPGELGNLSNLQQLYLDGNLGLSGSLPGSFTSLTSLRILSLGGTGLCAPTDAVFQMWLEGIATKFGVVNCVDSITD